MVLGKMNDNRTQSPEKRRFATQTFGDDDNENDGEEI
jgi:hypothetical protein